MTADCVERFEFQWAPPSPPIGFLPTTVDNLRNASFVAVKSEADFGLLQPPGYLAILAIRDRTICSLSLIA